MQADHIPCDEAVETAILDDEVRAAFERFHRAADLDSLDEAASDVLRSALTAAVPLELQRERERWEKFQFEARIRLADISKWLIEEIESLSKIRDSAQKESVRVGTREQVNAYTAVLERLAPFDHFLAAALPTEEGEDHA